MEEIFGQIAGLPIHPLVIHFAVVLVPIAAIGLILIVFSAKLRRRYSLLVLGLLAVSVPIVFIAKASGEALAEVTGITEKHEDFGTQLPWVVLGLFGISVIWYLLARSGKLELARKGVGVIVAGVSVVVLVLTFLVGHSGAEATWGNQFGQQSQESDNDAPTPTPSVTPSESASSDPGALTMEEVAKHSTKDDCWSVVDGAVYDLTPFVSRHPGGAAAIASLCGVDGTAAFMAQHGSQGEPNSELAGFKIGELVKP